MENQKVESFSGENFKDFVILNRFGAIDILSISLNFFFL